MRVHRGLIVVGMVAGSVALGRTGSAAGTSTTTQPHLAIDLGGTFGGWLTSASGGTAHTVGAVTRVAATATTKYDDITITTGEPSKKVCQLAKGMLDGASVTTDGALITANYDYKELSRLAFLHAVVDEVAFPALDVASKDTARLTLKLAPEKTAAQQGSGASVTNMLPDQHKAWQLSSFRVRVDGMTSADDAAIARVSSLVVTRAVSVGPNGVPTAAAPKVAPFSIVVPAAHAATFEAWAKSAASGDSRAPKNMTIDFLAPNMTDVVLTVQLRSVLPTKIEAPLTASGSTVQTLRVDLAAQSAALTCGAYFP